MSIIWPVIDDVITLHDQLIQEYTPSEPVHLMPDGIGLLESAIQRGSIIRYYRQTENVFVLAAAMAYAIAKAHAFMNGNKRTAFAVAFNFLYVHGYELCAEQRAVVDVFRGVAADHYSEDVLATWLDINSIAIENETEPA